MAKFPPFFVVESHGSAKPPGTFGAKSRPRTGCWWSPGNKRGVRRSVDLIKDYPKNISNFLKMNLLGYSVIWVRFGQPYPFIVPGRISISISYINPWFRKTSGFQQWLVTIEATRFASFEHLIWGLGANQLWDPILGKAATSSKPRFIRLVGREDHSGVRWLEAFQRLFTSLLGEISQNCQIRCFAPGLGAADHLLWNDDQLNFQEKLQYIKTYLRFSKEWFYTCQLVEWFPKSHPIFAPKSRGIFREFITHWR